ncbi:MAG TPA: hypothetical protein DIW43_05040, partial [Spongiibacteraceae bacterium]|nr:hypothetical protein [Spongiibacteraceae bacterium]
MIRILQGAIIGPAIVRGASCIALSLALGACNDGSSSGAVQSGATGALGNVPTSGVQTPEAFFARSIQPALENCRLCHVPGGPADVADGDALQLHATNTSEDYARLFAAWQR